MVKDSFYELNENDFIILDNYKAIINSLAYLFGDTCEIVLHALHDLNNSIIYIHNGEKTGRKLGSPMTDKGLKLLEECEKQGKSNTGSYFTKNANNHIMKSSSTIIRNTNNIPIGMLCINFDISTPLSDFIDLLSDKDTKHHIDTEHFASDIDDLLTTTVKKVQNEVINNNEISSRQKIKEIIIRLNNQGIFKLRHSVTEISEMLNISKDVIYLHLRNKK